ncbi:MAG: 50S ribosomal protein L30 [Candidatus Neomarinimicrobiota bacterium]|nr:50S ribosomal protein L30 [Candidatus Neomarinimicrobiota bacterium]RKY48026.1 MAG: 50S ribosomal protein L30 [Candidatus Neomarinimicrobiota bacterium]HDN59794.1 50S ribosomal protein L30 [Candidatus Neomarinimicrobiota bacterium]
MNAKKKEKLLKITQIKSAIGYRKKAKLTLEALGLRRMHQTVIKPDNPAIRGMIRAVSHLVKVEEVES